MSDKSPMVEEQKCQHVIRIDLCYRVFNELDDVLCKLVNNNKLTYNEVDYVQFLLHQKIMRANELNILRAFAGCQKDELKKENKGKCYT